MVHVLASPVVIVPELCNGKIQACAGGNIMFKHGNTLYHEELLQFLIASRLYTICAELTLELTCSLPFCMRLNLTWSDGRLSKASAPVFYDLQAQSSL